MKASELKQIIKEEIQNILKEATINFKRGDKIIISKEVSNRPLGGYAIFWNIQMVE
jgi:hypothetical protein